MMKKYLAPVIFALLCCCTQARAKEIAAGSLTLDLPAGWSVQFGHPGSEFSEGMNAAKDRFLESDAATPEDKEAIRSNVENARYLLLAENAALNARLLVVDMPVNQSKAISELVHASNADIQAAAPQLKATFEKIWAAASPYKPRFVSAESGRINGMPFFVARSESTLPDGGAYRLDYWYVETAHGIVSLLISVANPGAASEQALRDIANSMKSR